MAELYKKYRPTAYDQLRGQLPVVSQLKTWEAQGQIPHAILMSGPTGVGKTSTARILRGVLDCRGSDYTEINASESRGIDMVREIGERKTTLGFLSKVRMWVVDECSQLTAPAQHALLKTLEDVPEHCYYVLCTTDPQKLLPTIRSRCSHLIFGPISDADQERLVRHVLSEEGDELSEEMISILVMTSEGSARKILVSLEQLLALPVQERMTYLERQSGKARGDQIARSLLSGKDWPLVVSLVKECDEELEPLRRYVLAFAQNAIFRSPNDAQRAYEVIRAFRVPFFDSGKAGLLAACYEALFVKEVR